MARRQDPARRAFLKRAAAVSMMGGAAPLALNLAAAGEAAAFDSTDYKALVCVFLYGGNDHANTLVPYDADNYGRYSLIRGGGRGEAAGGIAFGRAQLTATALTSPGTPPLTDNLQYALAPGLTGLKSRWDAGQCAVLLNVGPLIVPLTQAQYLSDDRATYPLPPRLFSHNDQQSVWQSMAAEGSSSGWGGKLGDLAMASNTGQGSSLTCISAGGNAVFMTGEHVLQYQVGTNGPIPIYASQVDYWDGACRALTLRDLVTKTSNNVLENEFARVTRRAIDLEQYVRAAWTGAVVNTSFDVDAAPNPLADQLKVVARLIAARTGLGVKRQVFFVQLGGFDTHDKLMSEHAKRMAQLNEGLSQFQAAMVELGTADKVTTFTASDFGRTLASNGDGSDHGWGSHHFILGGAVRGGRYYGTAPHVAIDTTDQVGQGRLLPSTSVDQFAAALAKWFGASGTELSGLFPNLANFNSPDLGFMR
jgi:uncharacterized protein (DUF1501 family)